MRAPTLFVGLGGTGGKIIRILEENNRGSSQMIGYAIFDTDANELRTIRQKGFKGALIQTAENLTVGEYLDVDTEAADNWFPVNRILNRKTLTEGAGQVRSISRLAFDATVRAGGMDPLHREIERLYQLTSDDLVQSLRVVIVSSVAGGTGSGLVLPVAMYIRKYLAATYEQYSSIIRGFFMMPEIFDKVNSDQAERNSLSANAYATMKELDAFLRKGDGFLEPRYERGLRFPIPRAGSDEYDVSDAMPYDFCFLFDKRTTTNSVLENFEDYTQQAVTCLQGLSIEPTAKRNNSSEDNVIKELVEARNEGSCKRYCGIGAAELVYPYKDIVAYIAEYWKGASLNESWLRYDEEFKRQKKERKMREEALAEAEQEDISRGSSYVGSVQQETKDDLLGSTIRKQCDYRPGSMEHDGLWKDYVKAMDKYIQDFYEHIPKITQYKKAYKEGLTAVEADALSGSVSQLEEAASAFEKAEPFLTENSKKVFYHLCINETDDKECLWYWVKSLEEAENGFHPNSMRFFIYNSITELDKKIKDDQNKIKKADEWLTSDVAQDQFDLEITKDEIETRDTLGSAVEELSKKRFGKEKIRDEARDTIIAAYNKLYKELDAKYCSIIKTQILEQVREYLQNLSINFEQYYDELANLVGKNNAVIEDIQKKLSRRSGNTVRLVSATPNCLQEIIKKTEKNTLKSEVPGKLCNQIYQQLHKYTNTARTEKDKRKLEALQKQVIKSTVNDFWLGYVRDSISNDLDVNVIDAIMNEAEWEKGFYNPEEKWSYVQDVLKEMHQLAVPFLTKTTGGEKRVIYSCSYNEEIISNAGDAVQRILKEELADKGGETAEDCDRHKITFTQAMYGLSLNEIGKFTPVKESYVYGKQEGSYYSAYSDVVRHIHPNMTKTCYLTPHLDRHWHYINVMPEINDEEQKRLEEEMCCALIYGLVFKRFLYEQRTQYANVYKYRLNFKGRDKEIDLYSNDELCDNFYELLTALIKNRMTVEEILDYSQERISRGSDSVRRLDESYLMRSLKEFRLDEIDKVIAEANKKNNTAAEEESDAPAEKKTGTVRSIFEIPLIYARTAPMSEYDDTYANAMIQAAIRVLKETVDQYLQGDDASFRLCELIEEQYLLYLNNLKELKTIWRGIDKLPIDSQIRIQICEKVESLGDLERADRIRNSINDPNYIKALES